MLLTVTLPSVGSTLVDDLDDLLGVGGVTDPGRWSCDEGDSWLFWARKEPATATLALVVDTDTRRLTGQRPADTVSAHVSAHPYLANAQLSASLAGVFAPLLSSLDEIPGSALEPGPVTVELPIVDVGRHPGLVHRLLVPLGYDVRSAIRGDRTASLSAFTISGDVPLVTVLEHLRAVLPIVDDELHDWADDDWLREHGPALDATWMSGHPELDVITRRLAPWVTASKRRALTEERLDAVTEAVMVTGARSVLDLGCGTGRLLQRLADRAGIDRLLGADADRTLLAAASDLLASEFQPAALPTVELTQTLLTRRDSTLFGFDAACLVEVIEHIEPAFLPVFERLLFGEVRPHHLIITTPNRDFNPLLGLGPDEFRHHDHRFEWSRLEFRSWCLRMANRWGYTVRNKGVGRADPEAGTPTQMAVFELLPRAAPVPAAEAVPIEEWTLDLDLVTGRTVIDTAVLGPIAIEPEENASALELCARSGIDSRWLFYVPPIDTPVPAPPSGPYLEHPEQAYGYYQQAGLTEVICEQVHGGCRASMLVGREPGVLGARFGLIETDGGGVTIDQAAESAFTDPTIAAQAVSAVRRAVTGAGLWRELGTDWILIDVEVSPMDRPSHLSPSQHAKVAEAGRLWTSTVAELIGSDVSHIAGAARPDGHLADRVVERGRAIERYRAAVEARRAPEWLAFDRLEIAPIALVAAEGSNLLRRDRRAQIAWRSRLAAAAPEVLRPTPHVEVALDDPERRDAQIECWAATDTTGDPGMVMTPVDPVGELERRGVQPALHCRVPDALRLIYGPEFAHPDNLHALRHLDHKALADTARRQVALGVEAVDRLVAGRPLADIHQCGFAALAAGTVTIEQRR